MIFLLFVTSLLITYTSSAPGYLHGLDLYSSPLHAPLLPGPYLHQEPLTHSPIIKPILAPAPIIKTVAPLPVVKTILPTSYASLTSYHIAHPIKTFVAAPPIIKYAAPLTLAHGYH